MDPVIIMELRKLVCFLQICTCDSLSQAGRRLYMSQQGVSRLVHSLETELGVPLFYRGAQGIKLTEEGKLLKNMQNPSVGSTSFCWKRLRRADRPENPCVWELPPAFSLPPRTV